MNHAIPDTKPRIAADVLRWRDDRQLRRHPPVSGSVHADRPVRQRVRLATCRTGTPSATARPPRIRRPHRPRTSWRRAADRLPDRPAEQRRQGLDDPGPTRGPNTYDAPHLRYRDYFADMRVTVALRLDPEDESPTLDELADALQEPARPLFIGRKPCLPSRPLLDAPPCRRFVEARNTLAALLKVPLKREKRERDVRRVRLLWSDGEGVDYVHVDRDFMLTDERNWVSGLHGGGRRVFEGTSPSDCFGIKENQP